MNSNYQMAEDEVIIRRLLSTGNSEEEAFRIIIRTTQKQLYGIIRRITGDHMLTDDIMQDVYIKVFENIRSFRWKSSLSTWICRIGINEALRVTAREKKHRHSELTPDVRVGQQDMDYDRWIKHFRNAIARLPPQQRAVFIVRYYEDMSYKEMSAIMGLSEGGLKSNYHHAVKKIKNYLDKKGLK